MGPRALNVPLAVTYEDLPEKGPGFPCKITGKRATHVALLHGCHVPYAGSEHRDEATQRVLERARASRR